MGITYDIFARKEHPEPLLYLGSIEVDSADEVIPASLQQYGPESEWLEMVAVPHDKVVLVFSASKEEVAQ